MGVFSRKPKSDVGTAIQGYYDAQLFHPQPIAGFDPAAVYMVHSYEAIAKADPGFTAVSLEQFTDEVLVVRVEIFQTAWSHHFKAKTPYVVAESVATSAYLMREGRQDIQERMLTYNHAVAAGSVMLNVSSSEKLSRGSSAFVDSFRASLFKEWRAKGLDGSQAAMAANRVMTDVNFDKQGPARLAFAFAQRLGVQLNDEAAFACAAVLYGFYAGAREYLKQFDISA